MPSVQLSARLVSRAQTGDPQAQGELYETMYKRVYYLALRLTGRAEDAEDVAQEAFLSAFRALPNLKDPNAFAGWLFQITANQSRKVLRGNSRLAELPEDEEGRTMLDDMPDEDEGLIPSSALEKAAERQIIVDLIDSLPEQQRQCVYLFYYAQMSVRQIAETLGCSESTVKSRLNYARQKLKDGVLATEERDGIRLHSLAPLGLLLLKDCQFTTASLALPALWGASAAGTSSGASAGAAAAGSASSGAPGAAAGAAKGAFLTTVKAKVIAGIAAAALVAGGGAVVANLPPEGDQPAPPGYAEDGGAAGDGALAQEAMTFADPAMEANLRVLLGITQGPIYPEDAAQVYAVYLFADGMEIDRMDDYDPMLKSAPAAGTTAVASLADLRQLPLPLAVYDYTSDTALLSTLGELENLDCLYMLNSAQPVGDVAFLDGLAPLCCLELAVAGGTDLSPVERHRSLRQLWITSPGDIALDPGGLDQLFALDLSAGGRISLGAAQALPALRILDLEAGQLPSLGLLADFPGLQALTLWGGNLAQLDLSPLGGLADLRCLALNDTTPDSGGEKLDLSALSACPALEACVYPGFAAVNAPEGVLYLEDNAGGRQTEILQEILEENDLW